jgi:hypothetical protein
VGARVGSANVGNGVGTVVGVEVGNGSGGEAATSTLDGGGLAWETGGMSDAKTASVTETLIPSASEYGRGSKIRLRRRSTIAALW